MEWALEAERGTYEAIFSSLNPTDGKLSGKACKPTLVASKLPRGVLKQVWRLADVDNDGYVRAIVVEPTGGVCLPCGVVGSRVLLRAPTVTWTGTLSWRSSVSPCT